MIYNSVLKLALKIFLIKAVCLGQDSGPPGLKMELLSEVQFYLFVLKIFINIIRAILRLLS